MNKKNSIITTVAIILCGCTHQGLSRQEQILAAEADKIPPTAQAAYFECEFEKHPSDCRETVWKSHPHPTPESGLDREFVQRFLKEMDDRGASVVLEKQGIHCGTAQSVHDMFWKNGYSVTCQDNTEYLIDHIDGKWRISKAAKE